ncbi:DNA polymerase III subunit alpha [Halalkalibacillus halophilus]|uniref:DNA polymerase III subunit alpha n=1 Tax=Halalkalibacillus halophilus TaxID=392827 RepID=UPI00041FB271|nr:DNA polymerase III subunit alpha [Halalkalibacillus halophilus]
MNYTPLQIHSCFTLMESTVKLEQLVKRATELNFSALALTDHEVLHAVFPFIRLCKKANIKPIIGMTCDVYVPNEHRPVRFILLAKNFKGYQSLVHLSNKKQINQEDLMFQDIIDSGDLIKIISLYETFAEELIYLEQEEGVHTLLQELSTNIDEWYIDVRPSEVQDQIQAWLNRNGKTYADRAVITDNVRYLYSNERIGYEALHAMDKSEMFNEEAPFELHGNPLKGYEELPETIRSTWHDALLQTNQLAEQCQVEMDGDWFTVPSYPTEDKTPETMLKEICESKVPILYEEDSHKDAYERLYKELDIIINLNFADYFLIVWDIVRFAKKSNILTGPGRGSAAGSIVAYLLNITEVDPIKHDLLFERFLNPERATMPDIDIDFSDYRREEVLHYVKQKYGNDRVSQIVTFGTFQAKSIIRELSKVFRVERETVTYLLKQLPANISSLKEFIQQEEGIKTYIKQSDKLIKMFQAAIIIEGLPRHHSIHAAGVIISNESLLSKIPMMQGQSNELLTQLPMGDLEALGLLKMDFLGLRNLTLLERMIRQINEKEGKKLSLNTIPEQDERTYRLLRSGLTTGVFQLESDGMKNALKQVKPTRLEDIVAVNALYRPGPMQFIETFAKRKHGIEEVEYIDSSLKDILGDTYGVLVYQEQVMQIANRVANFSLGEADLLRRAISKKDHQAIQDLKTRFVDQAVENNYEYEIAVEVFSWIEKFGDYGFNKSHAVAYSVISYQIAYFKANYPAYFYAELLSSVMHDADKLEKFIKEANQMGVEVLPPSINNSYGKFTVHTSKQVRFGLLAIKGFGKQAYDELIRARRSKPFKQLFDFCQRVSLQVVNQSTLETLIIAGAFDETNHNRAQLLASLVQALEQGELFSDMDEQLNWEDELFKMNVNYSAVEPFPPLKQISMEKEVLGFRLSVHPLTHIRRWLNRNLYMPLNELAQQPIKKMYHTATSLERIKSIRTKRGEQMAFATLEDETGEMDCVIFPKVYRDVHRWLKDEQLVYVKGKLDQRNSKKQLIIEQLQPLDLDAIPSNSKQRLYLRLSYAEVGKRLETIQSVLKQAPGEVPVIVYEESKKKTYRLTASYDVEPNNSLLADLKEILGESDVVLKTES